MAIKKVFSGRLWEVLLSNYLAVIFSFSKVVNAPSFPGTLTDIFFSFSVFFSLSNNFDKKPLYSFSILFWLIFSLTLSLWILRLSCDTWVGVRIEAFKSCFNSSSFLSSFLWFTNSWRLHSLHIVSSSESCFFPFLSLLSVSAWICYSMIFSCIMS